MNLAASQRAPFICVIENNQWAYSTPVRRQVPVTDLADRAKAYGCKSFIVDGNDVVAVVETTRRARELCLAGEGPVIIESKTHRMRGHAQHDPAEYVPRNMFQYWEERDPIARFEKFLTENKMWSEKEKSALDEKIAALIEEDREFAENSPFPPPELAEQDVYCDGPLPIEPRWERPIEEVMPPKSSVKPEWTADPLSSELFSVYAKGAGPLERLAAGGNGAAPPHPAAPAKEKASSKNSKPAKKSAPAAKATVKPARAKGRK
jgi:hypothetical protein